MKACKLKDSARFSIRWKLVVYFALFVAVSIFVMWIFQVYLFNSFYEIIRRREMIHSAEALAAYVESEDLQERTDDHAKDSFIGIAVYKITGGKFIQIAQADKLGEDDVVLSPQQTAKALEKYYQKLDAEENVYTGYFTLGGGELSRQEISLFRFGGGRNASGTHNYSNIRLVHIQLAQSETGQEYLIVLNVSMRPLESTTLILRTQFIWVFSILLIFAGVMVWLLYLHISTPLMKINNSAKQLASGKYDVEFSADGYREAYELAQTLNYASHELSRLDHLQKELIANISHDLRTPLTMIKGYSEVMRDIPGENTAENIQVVIDETTRLSELVSDLLDLSKIQSGTRKALFEQFDLTAAVEEVMNRYDAFTAHQGYHIAFSSEERATVFADRSMLLQVLYNLINNAINYTGDDLSVKVQQTVQNGRVRISVSDTGQGIEADEIPQIWDRYYKVDKVHRRAMIGTGLGLSIVKGVLELHNATYGVESQVGVGSTFWFELDILDPAQEVRETIEQLEE